MGRVLITGAAGFIGFHLTIKLLELDYEVIGLDNLNDYYDPGLKLSRLSKIREHCLADKFQFIEMDIANRVEINQLFDGQSFDIVVNLAAQAGVRYSLENPHAYVDSNLVGFVNILEGCRHQKVQHLVYASSSSVYGMNTMQPFNVEDRADFPVSMYAATKRSNELLAHSYSHLFNIPMTGLRFFTVYGPYGRPDMAYFKFTKAIMSGQSIDIYNNGEMERDFTYIDDIVEAVSRVMLKNPKMQKSEFSTALAPFKLYNIGNNSPVSLMRFIEAIETSCGKKAIRNYMPMQSGDVPSTYAYVEDLLSDIEFKPATDIETGVAKFVDWYLREYCA